MRVEAVKARARYRLLSFGAAVLPELPMYRGGGGNCRSRFDSIAAPPLPRWSNILPPPISISLAVKRFIGLIRTTGEERGGCKVYIGIIDDSKPIAEGLQGSRIRHIVTLAPRARFRSDFGISRGLPGLEGSHHYYTCTKKNHRWLKKQRSLQAAVDICRRFNSIFILIIINKIKSTETCLKHALVFQFFMQLYLHYDNL